MTTLARHDAHRRRRAAVSAIVYAATAIAALAGAVAAPSPSEAAYLAGSVWALAIGIAVGVFVFGLLTYFAAVGFLTAVFGPPAPRELDDGADDARRRTGE